MLCSIANSYTLVIHMCHDCKCDIQPAKRKQYGNLIFKWLKRWPEGRENLEGKLWQNIIERATLCSQTDRRIRNELLKPLTRANYLLHENGEQK